MTDAILLGMVVLVELRNNWTTPTSRFTAYLSIDLLKVLSRIYLLFIATALGKLTMAMLMM